MAHLPDSMETEQRLAFVDNIGRDVVVFSGYAHFDPAKLRGDSDEEKWADHEVEMIVGPVWRDLRDVSPLVVRAGLEHPDSDVDDASGFQLYRTIWNEVNADPMGKRIQLSLRVKVKGENASVTRLAYQVTAVGTVIDVDVPEPSA